MFHHLRSCSAGVLHQVNRVITVVYRGQCQFHIALLFDFRQPGRSLEALKLIVHSMRRRLRKIEVRRLSFLSEQLLRLHFVKVRHALHVDSHVIFEQTSLSAFCFYRI